MVTAFFLLLVPLALAGQTAEVGHSDLSRGLVFAPASLSSANEPTAIVLNPAGLRYVGNFGLAYFHERSVNRDQVNDGVYLADSFFNALGVGMSVEWVRSHRLPHYRKTALALSLGNPFLALGATYNFFSSRESPDLNGLGSLDLGLIYRPLPVISLGLLVRNVGQPTTQTVVLQREYGIAASVRPFGDKVSVGVDYLFHLDQNQNLTAPIGPGGRLAYALSADILPGIALGAGFSHALRSPNDLFLQASLTLNFEHIGLTYAASGAPQGVGHLIGFRFSSDRYASLPLPRARAEIVNLAQTLKHSGGVASMVLGLNSDDPYLRLLQHLNNLADVSDCKLVILKIEVSPELQLGKAEELRQAIIRLRTHGKRVVALLLSAGDSEYFLASAADKIYATPESTLLINGLAAHLTFLRTLMDNLGIHWDVARVGAYKNFPDLLTRESVSPEQEQSVTAYLDTQVQHYETAVTQSRGISLKVFRKALEQGLLIPQDAKAFGLIDDVLPASDIGQDLDLSDSGPGEESTERDSFWGRRKKIAIIPIIGNISGGSSRQDPLGLSQIAGAETVVQSLISATEDSSVSAIVLRIDSPGGDGLASSLIYRAVQHAAHRKPVIASMGDLAASGGYYAAIGADEIWASPTTLTGSIGVFLIKPALQGLLSKIGVHQRTLKQSPMADILGTTESWTPDEQNAAQRWVNAFYDAFIAEVARSRHMSKEQVNTVAQGRIWSGTDAQQRHLVDHLGTLQNAIEAAKYRAGILPGEPASVVLMTPSTGLLGLFSREEAQIQLPPALRILGQAVGLSQDSWWEPGLKAVIPFQVTVQ